MNRHTFFLILFLLARSTCFGQISVINKLYADTVGNDTSFNRILANHILKYQADTLTLQSLKYNRVVAYRVNESYFSGESGYMECEPYSVVNRYTNQLSLKTNTGGKKLSNAQIKILLDIYSNPDNFNWAECGTPIPIAGFVFYDGNKISGYINIACNYGNTDCFPYVVQTKWGALSPQGTKRLLEFCKQLDIVHGKS